jgi:putative membrane protein
MEQPIEKEHLEKSGPSWVIYLWWLYLGMHFFGMLGISLEVSREWFLPLTPLTLSLGTFWVFWHLGNSVKNMILFVFLALLGWGIEVVGVSTGKIFGTYAYQEALGPKILEVPPTIGFNWAILVVLFSSFFPNNWKNFPRALGIGLLMTGLDAIIEPLCCFLNFWCWNDGGPGWKNFTAWAIFGTIMGWIWVKFSVENENSSVFKKMTWVQIGFFVGLLLLN